VIRFYHNFGGFTLKITKDYFSKMDNPIKMNLPDLKHEQLTNWMRENILSKIWPVNFKLISESAFAIKFKVSRGTVRKAIETLIDEGLIVRIHGRGTFVKQNISLEQKPAGRLAGFTHDLVSRGIPHTTEILTNELIRPAPDVANKLALDESQIIFHMKRLRLVKNKPVILIENHINIQLCEGIEKLDFSTIPLYPTLEDIYNIDFNWAHRTFWSKIADKSTAKTLKLKKGAPLMYLEELYHLSNGTPAEYTRAWVDAEVFYISTRIDRAKEKLDSPGIYR
jgi:DNA-binding GntR family transcriptional regulator